MKETDLPEVNGLIAKREHLLKVKGRLSQSDKAWLVYIKQRLEELGVEGKDGSGSN